MIFRQIAVGATALTLLGSAATGATFEGSTSGLFLGYNFFDSDPTDADNDAAPTGAGCTPGVGCTSVSWGRIADDVPQTGTRPRPAPTSADSERSVLSFRQTDFSEELDSAKETVDVAYIDWYNAEWTNFDDRFEFNAEFSFGLDGPIARNTFDLFSFVIQTTGNDSPTNDDQAVIRGFEDFRLGTPLALTRGYQLTGFTLSVLEDAGGSAFGSVDGDTWSTNEGRSSTLVISAQIEAVPLPAAGWLLIAGVGGLAAMKRRSKKAA
ncbi:VPLPA-CTERM sorting domain-containing protein [uncultured Roseobacter sp.]|uniref:VPLPA-CTERM sorting domain-containing protein n=1 Tax=uncultured Roseobacter sp. TaxID=114847 RepID=UPI0026337EA5|nr:VPLPA-CTERM sorting domain-containing protein [uncultured Roseobacter sp.]